MKKSVATIESLEIHMNHMDSNLKVLNTDVSILKTDVNILKTNVNILKTDVNILKTDVNILKSDVKEIKTDLKDFKVYFEDRFGELMNFLMENMMVKSEITQYVDNRIDTKFTKYTSDQFEFQDKVGKQCETNTNENLAMNQRVTLIEKHIGI